VWVHTRSELVGASTLPVSCDMPMMGICMGGPTLLAAAGPASCSTAPPARASSRSLVSSATIFDKLYTRTYHPPTHRPRLTLGIRLILTFLIRLSV
jgi:hypothetical protein